MESHDGIREDQGHRAREGLLGHKHIQNTLKYIHLANARTQRSAEYVNHVVTTVDEACALVDRGFEYVCAMDDTNLFRKRK